MKNKQPALAFLIGWHLLAATLLALLLPQLKFHLPLWRLQASELGPLVILCGTYVAVTFLSILISRLRRPLSVFELSIVIFAVFGLVFLYFLTAHVESTRVFMLATLCAALLLVPTAIYAGRWPFMGIVAIGSATLAVVALNLFRAQGLGESLGPRMEVAVIRTAFYNVRTVSYRDYIPTPAVRGGGLANLDDQYLLMTGDGYLYLIGWQQDDRLNVRSLPYRIPVNGDEFAKDTTGGTWRTPKKGDALSGLGEDAGSTVIAWWFRAVDVLTQERGANLRVFATHYFWKRDARCWVERVSMMEADKQSFLQGVATAQWRTVFESTPCLPIEGEGRRNGTPFAGHFGGGRMVLRDPDSLLLTVGDFGFNGLSSKQMFSQDRAASYGKIILLHLQSGTSEIYTSGNRNPQGLYMEPAGRIWDTEHGPQGGDELNLIKQNANYGWPIVTYGVDYGTFKWPLNPKQGDHEGFEAPYYAWLPSIGVSSLIGVERDLFPIWKGDLLVTSLVGKTIYRTRIRNDRVVYTEPIVIDKRIRDIAEGVDGQIVLWEDDDNSIVSMRPSFGSSGETAFATYCSGCHKIGDGTSHRIGPDLWGVVGRKLASADGYADYSAALRAAGGMWSEERLKKFIANPQAAVPGTAMEFDGVADEDSRTKIVQYLKGAQKVASR